MSAEADDTLADAPPVTAVIARLGARGDGIAETPDGPLYAPFTLAGERVRGRRHGDRLQDVEILEPSPDRVTPPCPHFGVCGGCAAQHLERQAYRAWKRGLVRTALARAGLEADVHPLRDAAGSGRRRATLHAVRAKAVGFVFGFAERASHHVFSLETCPVLHPRLLAALPGLRRAAEALMPKAGRADLHVTWTEAGLDLDLRGGTVRDPVTLSAALAPLAEAGDWARVTLAGAPLLHRRAPQAVFGGVAVDLPPGGSSRPPPTAKPPWPRRCWRRAKAR